MLSQRVMTANAFIVHPCFNAGRGSEALLQTFNPLYARHWWRHCCSESCHQFHVLALALRRHVSSAAPPVCHVHAVSAPVCHCGLQDHQSQSSAVLCTVSRTFICYFLSWRWAVADCAGSVVCSDWSAARSCCLLSSSFRFLFLAALLCFASCVRTLWPLCVSPNKMVV